MNAAWLADRLVRASVEGAALVLFVALIGKVAPALRARHRAALWWLATARLLTALVPIRPVELPLLPPPAIGAEAPASVHAIAGRWSASLASAMHAAPVDAAAGSRRLWIVELWGAGVIALFALSVPGAWRARALARSGRPSSDPALAKIAAAASARLGLRCTPPILFVAELAGPLVVGLRRPVVLLPEDAAVKLTSRELAMAVEHELAHIARRDLWFGLVPAAARRAFFFHPLAWWAEREYAIAREAACDEAVVQQGDADVFVYGRLLLRLAAGRHTATAALSPRSMLRRRLEMIETTVRRRPLGARIAWALVALALVGFIPMRLVAREAVPEAPPAPAAAPSPETVPAPEAPPTPEPPPPPVARVRTAMAPTPVAPAAPPTTPASPTVPRSATGSGYAVGSGTAVGSGPAVGSGYAVGSGTAVGSGPANAPTPRASTVYPRSATPPPPPPAPGSPADAPEAPTPPPPPSAMELERCLDLGSGRDSAFVVTNGDAHTMCGEIHDVEKAERARVDGGDVIWFRVDGQDWVVRDPATVAQARDLFKAEQSIGEEQSKLGDVQSAIGDKQSALADTQSRLAAAQEKIAASLTSVDRNLDLEAKMNELSKRMEELGRQMEQLSEQQAEMGVRQGALGEQMAERGAEAQRRLAELLSAAMKNGQAEKLR